MTKKPRQRSTIPMICTPLTSSTKSFPKKRKRSNKSNPKRSQSPTVAKWRSRWPRTRTTRTKTRVTRRWRRPSQRLLRLNHQIIRALVDAQSANKTVSRLSWSRNKKKKSCNTTHLPPSNHPLAKENPPLLSKSHRPARPKLAPSASVFSVALMMTSLIPFRKGRISRTSMKKTFRRCWKKKVRMRLKRTRTRKKSSNKMTLNSTKRLMEKSKEMKNCPNLYMDLA